MNNSALKAIGSTAIRPRHSLGTASRPLLSILTLVLSLSFGAGQVRAQCGSLGAPSTTWQNGGNSFWNLDGNWTSGTPTASTNACILNGVSTVTLNTTGNANGLQLASGNTLNINAGDSLSLASGSSSNSGTLTNFGGFGLGFVGAAFTNNAGAHVTNFGGMGWISGSVVNNDAGAFLVNLGTIDFFSTPDASLARLVNSGTFINNAMISGGYNNLENSAGAHFDNSGTIDLFNSSFFDNAGKFNNSGTFSFFGSEDPAAFSNSGTFNNSGKMTLGYSPFTDNLFSNSGTINNSGTMSVQYVKLDVGDDSFSNSGKINNSGTLTISASGETGNLALIAFNNSGTINNSGTLNNTFASILDNSGAIKNTGTLNNTDGASLTNGGTLTNAGTIFNDSTSTLTNSGTLKNFGTINNNGAFTNSGAVTISNSGLFTTSTNYTQTAGKTLVNGALTATGGAIVDIQGGALSGTGAINGDVLMKGIMSPGSGGAPGTFTINGNYEQGGTGVFDELIRRASSNGVLDVTGILALDPGSLLEITLQGGFDPLGDSFTILDYGSLVGEFSNGSTFFADGFNWTLVYGPNDAVLTAVSTPEPNTMPLIAIGLLALCLCEARRRAAL